MKCLVKITAVKRNEDGGEVKLESKGERVSCRGLIFKSGDRCSLSQSRYLR